MLTGRCSGRVAGLTLQANGWTKDWAVVTRSSCALIAGADAPIRQLLRTVLEIGGYDVIEAASQGDVLARLAAATRVPDVVILDVLLPTFSGLATLSYLRREPRVSHVPVVILTSFTDVTDHASFTQSGATAVVTKPFSSTRLLQLVNDVVGAAR